MTIEERLEALEKRVIELELKLDNTIEEDKDFYDALNELANANIDDVLKFYRGA